ncbi:MAG: hypothetical protein COA37_22145 [Hoeflea sp.]|uniref:hypothetical protein n=1 Tax=Hoeflea sp. TaxID=1940281 RepID=UPI000C1087E3|nr:hypothetical protein [Hoeflea sp.]PHR17528.1 MAG: hypothetical protein COA37_22145 [Hoeflea sp.]
MTQTPKSGPAGTTDQSPRWEGPEETRPSGYLPAKEDPETDRDAAEEDVNDTEHNNLADIAKKKMHRR